MTVLPRPGEQRLDARDAEILATVADQAAPALSALRLHHQLQQSREQLVLAREGERRTLRRDLHDGLGATLAGVRLQLESAAAVSDHPEVTALLEAASSGVAQAVAEVRTVTDALRPPAIDDIGLAAALDLLAERFRTPALRVEPALGDLTGLPAAVEVATYRIASEALTNAARHASATQVRLAAATESGRQGTRVVIDVVDDGVGIGLRQRPGGLGLQSMRDRAEELGGTLELSSPLGPVNAPDGPTEGPASRGTRVRAVLPVPTTVTPSEVP
jgi:signal transduction histidine kinase